MKIETVRGNIAIDFTHEGRLYTLLITPLSNGYFDWMVSADYKPIYERFGLQVPEFIHRAEDLIKEALPYMGPHK